MTGKFIWPDITRLKGGEMPKVKGKTFPYTKKGKMDAKKHGAVVKKK